MENNKKESSFEELLSLFICLIEIGKFMGLDCIFKFTETPKEYYMDLYSSRDSIILSELFSIPDFFLLFCVVFLFFLREYGKKNYKYFIIGAIVFVLSLTPVGKTSMLINGAVRLARLSAVYSEEELDEAEREAMLECGWSVTRNIDELDYVLDAHLDKHRAIDQNGFDLGMEAYAVGTITNNSDIDWDYVTLSFYTVDENGNNVTSSQFGDQASPLSVSIENVKIGETVSFQSAPYFGVMDSDYEPLKDVVFDSGEVQYHMNNSEKKKNK